MAFFPHLNDVEQRRRLDGWLLNALRTAIELRRNSLQTQFVVPRYPDLSLGRLLTAEPYGTKLVEIKNDVRVPSFMRAWKYGRKALGSVGLRRFPSRRFRAGDEDLYE